MANDNETAAAFHAAIAAVDLGNVKRNNVLERNCPRKEFAAAVRALLKLHKIKGVSVTAPNYSMASGIDIRTPKRDDYVLDKFGMVVEGDAARAANGEATRKLEAIMVAAFPSHRDRSDSQSDHFNFRWLIS